MGDVAFREDAVDRKRFLEYITNHYQAWMDFADTLGRDLSPSDLILVDGCDKTSEWACAAWSEKTQSVRLSFVAGVPGIAEGSAGLWGWWLSSQSLYKNVGPRPLIPVSDPTLQLTSQSSDIMSIDEQPPTPAMLRLMLSTSPPLSNQCVFVRGFQIGDRTKWFKRKKTRIDAGSGFKIVSKYSVSKKKGAKPSTQQDSSQQPVLHLTSGDSSQRDTSLLIDFQSSGSQNEVYSDPDDELLTDIE